MKRSTVALLIAHGWLAACDARSALDVGSRGMQDADAVVTDSAMTDADAAGRGDASDGSAIDDGSTDGGDEPDTDASIGDASTESGTDACAGPPCVEWPAVWSVAWAAPYDGGATGSPYTANGGCGGQGATTFDAQVVWRQTSDWNHLRHLPAVVASSRARAFEIRFHVPPTATAGLTIGFRNTPNGWNDFLHDGYAFELSVGSPNPPAQFNVGGLTNPVTSFAWSVGQWITLRVEEDEDAGAYRAFINGALLAEGTLDALVMRGEHVIVHSTGSCSVDHVYIDSVRVELGCPGDGC